MKKYFLLFFMGLTCVLNAQKIELDVAYVNQEQPNWCTVAATKSVLDYKGIIKLQCDIMDYIRSKNPIVYGSVNCCLDLTWGCKNAAPVGFGNEQGSAKDALLYFSKGTLDSEGWWNTIWVSRIEDEIKQKRPIIVQWYRGSEGGHVVVIRGIEKIDLTYYIYYMDPANKPYGGLYKLTYDEFLLKDEPYHWWVGTLCLKGASTPPCNPEHCCNRKFEPELGEFGLDCGGTCPNECPPPPAEKCTNCQQDPDEECIDCGGDDCKPCDDVPKEKIVSNTTQLRKEVAAFNKITAKDNVVIQTGKQVSFITNNEGSIVLKPGFKAEKGCTFTTQRWVDLSGFGRECGTICKLDYVSQHVVVPDFLKIYQLINAVEVAYYIYDKASTNRVYENHITITSNNEVYILWDCVVNGGYPAGTVWYIIEYYVYCCDSTYYKKRQEFSVNYFPYKSSNDDIEVPDDPEKPNDPETQLSPPVNSIALQNESTAPNFSIIPNPNGGTFQLETNFPLTVIENFKITNMLGVPVYESQNITSHTIQLTGLAAGQYFVVVLLKDGTFLTQKLMLQR